VGKVGEDEKFGIVFEVDLSTEKIKRYRVEDKELKRFIGGEGIAAYFYWKNVPPHIAPFDEENCLIFATGPLTGTDIPGAGRAVVAGKSPQSYPEGYTISSFGGEWGAELRYAGCDVLLIRGRAEKPVYLWIKNSEVEIRNAEHLWGKDTFETRRKIKDELNDEEVKIISIGKAGENKVRFASIIHRSGHAAGQGGFGAVMGSKNLKAVAVRGTRRGIQVADPEKTLQLVEHVKKLATLQGISKETSPLYEGFSKVGSPVVEALVPFIQKYKIRNTGCMGCPKPCHVFLDIPNIGAGEITCVQWFYGWLQLGVTGEVDEASFLAKTLADKHGINVYELLQMIPFLLVAVEKNLISEKDLGIPASKFPSKEFIEPLISKIANREGLGDALAEGTWRFAEKIGKLNEYLSLSEIHDDIALKFGPIAGYMGYSSNGHGYCAHYDPRDFSVAALLWATNHRDPWSYSHEYIAIVEWSGLDFEEQQKVGKVAYGSENSIHPMGAPNYTEDEARAAIIIQNRSVLKNSLILCDWIYPLLTTPASPDYIGDPTLFSKMYSAVTGEEVTEEYLLSVGERIFNLERAILVREGRRREGDSLPEYLFNYPHYWTQSPPLNKEKWEKFKDLYYVLRGWDPQTGIPTKEKLTELGLNDIAEELKKYT